MQLPSQIAPDNSLPLPVYTKPGNSVFDATAFDSFAIVDKSVVINSAIAAGSLAGGGKVRIPSGWVCTTQSPIVMRSGIALEGDGDSSIVTALSANILGIVTIPDGVVNWKVRNLAIQGNASNGITQSHAAIYVQQSTAIGGAGLISNVTSLNNGGQGVSIFVKIEPNNPYIRIQSCRVFGLYGNALPGTGYGVLTTSDHTSVVNNTFAPPVGQGRNGVYISGTATTGVRGAKVLGNDFVGFTNVVITGHSGGTGTVNAIIQGNSCLDHAPSNATVSAIGIYGAFYGVRIDNNEISSTGLVGSGISIQSAGDITLYTIGKNCSITNNHMSNIGGHGIDIEGAAASGPAPNQYPSFILIRGNQIDGFGVSSPATYAGIKTASVNNVIIKDNQIDGQGSGLYGVNITPTAPTSTSTLVEGNGIVNVTVGVNDQGVASRVVNNPGYNPIGLSAPAVGASPWTFTNGSTPCTLYVKNGTVSLITKSGSTLYTSTNVAIPVGPGESVIVTYSVAPTVAVDTQ